MKLMEAPRTKQIVKVSIVGILTNIVLVVFKSLIGIATGSIAIVNDAINNLSDVLSSVITIVGVKLASKRPDKKHPYGHGRIEHISAVVVAVVVIVAGISSFVESVARIQHPTETNYSAVAIIIMVVAVAAKLFLGLYTKKRGLALNSESLQASGTDALFDAIITTSTILAAIISIVWGVGLEGWLGLLISIVIVKAGVDILLESLNGIIGLRIDSDLAQRVKDLIVNHPNVRGVYDLALHRYGPETIIGSAHIELPDDLTAKEIHRLTRHIIEDVFVEFGIVLTIGIYASNTSDPKFMQVKTDLEAIVAKHPEVLQLHAFYVDDERMQISFDLVMDFDCPDMDASRDEITAEIQALYPNYRYSVIIDNDFSD